jgi:hypothetical protein
MSHVTFEKDFAYHPMHYFSLLCVMVLGLWGIFWFDYNRMIQLGIAGSLGVSHVVWGIIHHWYHRDLHLKIIAEYVLWAVFAIVTFASLLLRT